VATKIDLEAQERERLAPYVDELMGLIRKADPEATYSLGPGPDEGIWLLDVFIREPLEDDLELHAAVSERAVDFQVRDGVSIAVIPHQRVEASASGSTGGAPQHSVGRLPREG